MEHDILPQARRAGTGTLSWSPLASGFLSGKYTRQDPSGGGGRRAGFSFPPVDTERGYDVVDVLSEVAATHAATPAQVALAWLLAQTGVTSLIVGATRIDQLEENLASVDLTLTDAELKALGEANPVAPVYPAWMWAAQES